MFKLFESKMWYIILYKPIPICEYLLLNHLIDEGNDNLFYHTGKAAKKFLLIEEQHVNSLVINHYLVN